MVQANVKGGDGMITTYLIGYVEKAVKSPFEGQTVMGQWASFSYNPGYKYTLKQYREEVMIGTWRIKSVASLAGAKKYDTAITVVPEIDNATIEPGDIIAQEGVDLEFWDIGNEISSPVIGNSESYPDVLKVIIYNIDGGVTAAIATTSSYKFNSDKDIDFKYRGKKIQLSLIQKSSNITPERPFEVKIKSNVVSLRTFINTMNPIRSFILDAGEEQFYSVSKRARKKLSVFEPNLALKAGSIRIMLSPVETEEMELFSKPDQPYILLYKAMKFAERQNMLSLLQMLGARFYDVKRYLSHLLAFSRIYKGETSLEFILGEDRIEITHNSFETIQAAIATIKEREITITGMPYAIDTKRHWFKVIDETSQVDWKFFYTLGDDGDILVNNIQKILTVKGLTLSSEGATRGVAKLSKIIIR